MGCLNAPELPIPTLGGGLSASIPLPSVSFDAALCCKTLSFSAVPSPIAFGVAIPPGLMNVIVTQIKIVQAFIDAIPPKCPKE